MSRRAMAETSRGMEREEWTQRAYAGDMDSPARDGANRYARQDHQESRLHQYRTTRERREKQLLSYLRQARAPLSVTRTLVARV